MAPSDYAGAKRKKRGGLLTAPKGLAVREFGGISIYGWSSRFGEP